MSSHGISPNPQLWRRKLIIWPSPRVAPIRWYPLLVTAFAVLVLRKPWVAIQRITNLQNNINTFNFFLCIIQRFRSFWSTMNRSKYKVTGPAGPITNSKNWTDNILKFFQITLHLKLRCIAIIPGILLHFNDFQIGYFFSPYFKRRHGVQINFPFTTNISKKLWIAGSLDLCGPCRLCGQRAHRPDGANRPSVITWWLTANYGWHYLTSSNSL